MGEDKNESLQDAISKNDQKRVRLLLEGGADPNFSYPTMLASITSNPLGIASNSLICSKKTNEPFNAAEEIVFMLIKFGADPDQIKSVSSTGESLLMYCLMSNVRLPVIKALIPLSKINAQDSNGNTILMTAISSFTRWNTNVIKDLLDHGADANTCNNLKETALNNLLSNYCSEQDAQEVRIINLLLQAGADARFKDALGNSALDYAKRYRHDNIVQLFIAKHKIL